MVVVAVQEKEEGYGARILRRLRGRARTRRKGRGEAGVAVVVVAGLLLGSSQPRAGRWEAGNGKEEEEEEEEARSLLG